MDQLKDKRFAVGFSFPGTCRGRVETIADYLTEEFSPERILFDGYLKAELAKVDLDVHLQKLYFEETELIVVFICHEYTNRLWCGVEWRAIRARLNRGEGASIMFLKVDDGEPDGFFGTVDGSIDISELSDKEVSDLILERYHLNKGIPYDKQYVPYAELKRHLSSRLAWHRSYHPSFRLMDIRDDLFPEGLPELHNLFASSSDNQIKPVREIIEDSWNREKNHLMIEGEGGIGKTVTLLSLPEKFVPHPVPAVYIQLHELKGVREDETIEDYIRSRVFFDNEPFFRQFNNLTNRSWDGGPQILLLLDGFNEIAPGRRFRIGEDINTWAKRPGVQMITSSRFDIHTYVPLGEGYSKILLQPLSHQTIGEYLKEIGIPPPRTLSQWSIINYPLMLSLYAQTERALRVIDRTPDQAFRENNTAGDIIWNYLQREIWRFRQNPDDILKCVLAAEVVAPFMAWRMQAENRFYLEESSFWDLIDDAFVFSSSLNTKQYSSHIRRILRRNGDIHPQKNEIQRFLEEELRIFMKKDDDTYTLMHQQFRDALAAIHLINVSYASSVLPDAWKKPVDHTVMSFVSELIPPENADRLWDNNKSADAHDDVATINVLELQSLLTKNDFSNLDFSGLDLSNISLFSYKAADSSKLLLPHDRRLTKGLSISYKSFAPQGHSSYITGVVITSDGKECISGSFDKTIRIWNLETGQCRRTLEGHTDTVSTLALMPGGKRCISGSRDGTARVWNLETGECLHVMEGHIGGITAQVLTSDGLLCINGAHDCVLRAWNPETGRYLRSFRGHQKPIHCVAITPDGKKCVSGSLDGMINVWEIETGRLINSFGTKGRRVCSLVITSDGNRCISGSFDHTIRIWDIGTGTCLRILTGHSRPVTSLILSPDAKKCLSSSKDCTIRVWDIETGQCLMTLQGHTGIVFSMTVTPDGEKCVSASRDNTLIVWDLVTKRRLRTLEGHEDAVHYLAITPDGKECVSGSHDHSLRVWDLETAQCLKVLEGFKGANAINALVYSPDGRKCISGAGDKTIRIWDLETSKCRMVLEGHEGFILVLAVTPDGKACISGSADNTIRVWDLETGKCIRVLKGHERPVTSLVVSENGRICISGSTSGTIRVWNLDSGQNTHTLAGHTNRIASLVIAPGGKRFLSASHDNSICIWDLETFQCIRKMEGHQGTIAALSVSPDGKRCFSISRDKTLRVWDLPTGQCIKVVESRETSLCTASPDGKLFLGTSISNNLYMIDLERLQIIREVDEIRPDIKAIAFNPQSSQFVVGFENDELKFYDRDFNLIRAMTVLPLSIVGANFSQSIISSPGLREYLLQNGAVV